MTCVGFFTYILFIVILQCTNSFFVTRYIPSIDYTTVPKITLSEDTEGMHHTFIDKRPTVPILGPYGKFKLRHPQKPFNRKPAYFVKKSEIGSKYQYSNNSISTEEYRGANSTSRKVVSYTYVPVKLNEGDTTTAARTTNSSVAKSFNNLLSPRADDKADNNSRRWWFFDKITPGDAFTGKSIVAKCYICNQHDTDVPKDGGLCHNAFESEDWRSKTKSRYFRAHCYYNWNKDGYKKKEYTWRNKRTYKTDRGLKIALAGKYKGGCYKRFLDVGEVHTSRGCRKYWPHSNTQLVTQHRFLRLELQLEEKKEGCIFSPYASLSPFARAVSLYTRYHVCVCSGRYCNKAITDKSFVILIYFVVLLFIFL